MENWVSQNVMILARGMIILFLCLDCGKFYTNFLTTLHNRSLKSIRSKNIYYQLALNVVKTILCHILTVALTSSPSRDTPWDLRKPSVQHSPHPYGSPFHMKMRVTLIKSKACLNFNFLVMVNDLCQSTHIFLCGLSLSNSIQFNKYLLYI